MEGRGLRDWEEIATIPQLGKAALADPKFSVEPLPDVVAIPARAIASSGSTGTPKIIQSNVPGEGVPGQSLHNLTARYLGHHPGQVVLVMAPMCHTNGSLMCHSALFEARRNGAERPPQEIVLMEKFDEPRSQTWSSSAFPTTNGVNGCMP